MRALVCVAILLGCSRERPRSDPQPLAAADAAVDVDLLAELQDVRGDAIFAHETAVSSIKVIPATALTNAGETLGRERWRFRPCAVHVTEPTSVDLTVRVGEGGEVVSSTAEAPSALSKCLCDAAQKLKFSEPAGGSAALEITLRYAPR